MCTCDHECVTYCGTTCFTSVLLCCVKPVQSYVEK